MLRYRAASFFGRTYAPDVTMGIYTKDEVEDIGEDRYQVIETDNSFEKEKEQNANKQELNIETELVEENQKRKYQKT